MNASMRSGIHCLCLLCTLYRYCCFPTAGVWTSVLVLPGTFCTSPCRHQLWGTRTMDLSDDEFFAGLDPMANYPGEDAPQHEGSRGPGSHGMQPAAIPDYRGIDRLKPQQTGRDDRMPWLWMTQYGTSNPASSYQSSDHRAATSGFNAGRQQAVENVPRYMASTAASRGRSTAASTYSFPPVGTMAPQEPVWQMLTEIV